MPQSRHPPTPSSYSGKQTNIFCLLLPHSHSCSTTLHDTLLGLSLVEHNGTCRPIQFNSPSATPELLRAGIGPRERRLIGSPFLNFLFCIPCIPSFVLYTMASPLEAWALGILSTCPYLLRAAATLIFFLGREVGTVARITGDGWVLSCEGLLEATCFM